MKFWLIRGNDERLYITEREEMPIRNYDTNYSHIGWNVGFPGTADVDNVIHLIRTFGIFYNDVKEAVKKVPAPTTYNSDPVEVEMGVKIHWYG